MISFPLNSDIITPIALRSSPIQTDLVQLQPYQVRLQQLTVTSSWSSTSLRGPEAIILRTTSKYLVEPCRIVSLKLLRARLVMGLSCLRQMLRSQH